MASKLIPIEVSGRHLHISEADYKKLFGPDHQLQVLKKLSQPGQFACVETVRVIGPAGEFPAVRIVGPVRSQTQLELSLTDCLSLGIAPKVRVSGDLEKSNGDVTLTGQAGQVELKKGVIVAQRHLHIAPLSAKTLGLKHLDLVSVKTLGQRSVLFEQVVVRSRENIDELAFMIDTDEANAAGVKTGDQGELIIKKS